ncbi:MAG: tRNA (adenosine(37)-N6)-threonylcarbamoyltransferase complex ATPase subunit type 1 TsaE [Elusimicrobiota bacterium]
MDNSTACGKLVKKSGSPPETFAVGRELAKSIKRENIFLCGELGAGKTTFLKGVGKGLGLKQPIISPTFQLVRKYKKNGSLKLIHIDLYRLNKVEEILHLGWHDFLENSALTAVEWADRAADIWPEKALFINIRDISPSEREIEICRDKDSVSWI